MAGELAVVVVNYGSSTLLEQNLTRIQASARTARIVVVDNRTTTGELDAVTSLALEHRWELVVLPTNRGFGGGMNEGVRRARELGSTEFLLVNPDAWLDADCLSALRRRLGEDRLTLVAPVIRRPDGSTWFEGSEMLLADGSMRRCPGLRASPAARPWLTGAVLLLSAELWERVGGFDERYFLYWEDVDLSHRVVQEGGRLVVAEDAVALHDEGGTQEAGSDRGRSAVYYYYNIRNRMLYALLHLDADTRRQWLRSSPAAARDILLRGGRRQFLHPVGPLRAAARGLWDGWRLVRTRRIAGEVVSAGR